MKTKLILLTAALFTGSIACNTVFGQKKEKIQVTGEKASFDLKKLKKNAKGAYILFDGKSLQGWRGYDKTSVPQKWVIDDGALKFDSKSEAGRDQGGDLIFDHEFKNFVLELEWKVAKGANSGIFYLAKEIPGKPIYISAPEYQILDNENHPDAKMGIDGNRKSGSLYDMIAAKPQNGKPFGEWNKVKIVVNNGVVEHWQNDVKVVTYHLWDQSWIDLLQKSKFSEAKWPDAYKLLSHVGGESKSGLIGLQDHGDEVWYKNITVKVLK